MEIQHSKAGVTTNNSVRRGERFVAYIIEKMQRDNGFAARLRRADNPATEYQSWELLADFGVDLEKDWERMPFCTIGAALAKAKPDQDGGVSLGAAIAACYEDGAQSNQARTRLRRLLACSTVAEACLILRSMLALINSRGVKLDFSQLLEQLLWYAGNGQERVRSRWAQDFYRRTQGAAPETEGGTNE